MLFNAHNFKSFITCPWPSLKSSRVTAPVWSSSNSTGSILWPRRTEKHLKKFIYTFKLCPEFKLIWASISVVLVTCKFDEDMIIRSFSTSKAANSVVSGPIRPNSNSSEILCMSSLPASIERIGSKAPETRLRHHFPHYKSMGAFCCHGNQRFDPICPKTLCSLSPTPMMLHIKFDQDGQLASEIFSSKSNSPCFYACPGYQQLWWWFNQNWTS